jgi:hypothetical protein
MSHHSFLGVHGTGKALPDVVQRLWSHLLENISSLVPEISNIRCMLSLHSAFYVTRNEISDEVRSAEL